jgi:hypothetical protein
MFMLNDRHTIPALLILVLSALLTSCASQTPAQVTDDGLDRVESSDFDLLYVRADSDFSAYDSMYVLPVTVEFDRSWLRQINGSDPTRFRERDQQRVRDAINQNFTEVFVADLAEANGYTIAEEPGPATLVVKPAIRNLRLANPNTFEPYRITVLAEEAGSMTIELDLVDGESNEALLRLSDYRRGRNFGRTLRIQNSVTNKQEGNNLFRRWARSLNATLQQNSAG